MNRDQSIDFVENTYFGRVREGDLAGLLTLFTAEAEIIVYHGDGAPDRFSVHPGPDEQPVANYFQYVIDTYEVDYSDFHHSFDPENSSHACTFTVHLNPRDGSAPSQLSNCNFFRFEDDRISHIVIYYVNPNI